MEKLSKSSLYAFMQKHLGLVLFFSATLIGLVVFDDYGIGFDEMISRENGIYTYKYVFQNDPALLEWKDRDYGIAVEFPLAIAEKALGLTDSRSIFLLRHFVSHLIFLVGGLFAYKLAFLLYQKRYLGTVAFLLYMLHPRLYAQSFFNSKDIPFLALFMISLYYAAKISQQKTNRAIILGGIFGALLINIRILGVIIPFWVSLLLVMDALCKSEVKAGLKRLLIYNGVLLSVLYGTWPFLWSNPIENFLFAFQNMSHFRWGNTVLYFGDYVYATEIPWHYIPTWFLITTPILFSITLLFGLVNIALKTPWRMRWNSWQLIQKMNLLFLILSLGPIFLVIVLHSVLYDGWRQMYFIYAPMIMIITYAIYLAGQKLSPRVLSLILGLIFISPMAYMIKNHPFQQVYFVEPLRLSEPEILRRSFELDYWAVSYKQGLEWLLQSTDQKVVRIMAIDEAWLKDIMILPRDQRDRIIVDRHNPQYYFTNYRWVRNEALGYEKSSVKKIKASQSTFVEIYDIADSTIEKSN